MFRPQKKEKNKTSGSEIEANSSKSTSRHGGGKKG